MSIKIIPKISTQCRYNITLSPYLFKTLHTSTVLIKKNSLLKISGFRRSNSLKTVAYDSVFLSGRSAYATAMVDPLPSLA